MTPVMDKLYRLSPNQLRALRLLAKVRNAMIVSSDYGAKIGLKGKNLGGLFSALSRQQIKGEKLVLPWGRPEPGGGLRWKLNQNLISAKELLAVTDELLS